jgi:aryl-alcohol dehydrogenase-like predicted oxidoreductase
MHISTIPGAPACPLALAANPDQDPKCVERAAVLGINFFFFYSPGHKLFVEALKPVVRQRRNEIILASGSGSRSKTGLRSARRKILAAIDDEMIDIFFAEYINPGDHEAAIFGSGGVLDELQQWKAAGTIRFVGVTAHDRALARKLAEDVRVDVLMHRFNMAHRKASEEVFPAAVKTKTPIIAFTATRWGSLLNAHPEWAGKSPTAADCYRFCLAQPAVQIVLTAPKSIAELEENLAVAKLPPMDALAQRHWQRFGDVVYKQGGGAKDDYESRWP